MINYYFKRLFNIFNYIFTDFKAPQNIDYDKYWEKRNDLNYSKRFDSIIYFIEGNSTLLDIGCGDGSFLKYLKEKKGIQGEGIDISEIAIKKASEKGVKCYKDDITSNNFKLTKNYDYIILSEVIEHIIKPEDLINKLIPFFNKGIIITIPNTGYYLERLRLLFGRFPIQWQFSPYEHIRFWALKDFKNWIKQFKELEIVSIKAHTGFLFLYKIFPSLFADCLVFYIKKKL